MKAKRRTFIGGASAAALLSGSGVAFAQKKYDEGASDTEIKIGHCGPYSGPASAYGVIGKSHQAFFKAVNDAGGVNGRKINFITLDDGYSPPKAVEDVRQLVEQDKVLLLFQTLGTIHDRLLQPPPIDRERSRAIVERMAAIPRTLEQARANLEGHAVGPFTRLTIQALDKDGYTGKIGLETQIFDGTLIAAAHTSMEEIMRIVSELS